MVGITSYGAYVPMLRLPLAAIGGGAVKPGGPEKAVANWDEDAVTMVVAAAIDCLRGVDRASVDGVLFASTSYPLKEKQGAALVARALDLRRDVMTADLGDAAAAFLVGEDDVAVALAASHTVADEIIDVWRAEGDPFVHAWEDRFVVDHGYRANVREVVRGLLAKTRLGPKDFAKLVLYGPDARSHAALVRELGFEPPQAQDALFGKVGNAGTAFAPLLLAAALEGARAGQRILLVGYGDGAEAFVLETTPVVERLEGRRGVSWHLARRAELPSYDLYLRFRQLLATEHDRRAGAGISATKHFRDRDDDVTLAGLRCRRCGCLQYPRQRVCFRCFARDDFERVRLSDKIGAVKSFTFDNFAGSPSPPLIATVVDVEGARLYLQMTDASPKEVKLDLPVELTFRKMHEAGGTPNYYWKCTPVRRGRT